MNFILKFSLVLGFILLPLVGVSQKKYFKIFFIDSTNEVISSLKTEESNIDKSISIFRNKLISKGYLLVDIFKSDSIHYIVSKGIKFKTLHLKSPNGKFEKRKPRDYARYLNEELKEKINRGYPFYSIYLDSLQIDGNDLFACKSEVIGPFVKWRNLHANSDSSISKNMIVNITGIKIGEHYQENKIKKLNNRLIQFNYIEVLKPAEILFTPEGAELFTYIKYKKMSSLQGALGLQPNPVTQQIGVTGDLQLKLINVLKRAEFFDLNWRSVQTGTSNLNVKGTLPFLFKSPFGLDGKFQIYKRDSSFLEVKSLIAIQYNLQNGTLLKGMYQLFNSNTLNAQSPNPLFPLNAQIHTNFFGFQIERKSLDDFFNPRKGIIYSVESAVGSRFSSTDNTKFVSTVFKFQGDIEFYQPLKKRHILKFRLQGEKYIADSLYSNERIRTGGLNSIRGFNEEGIFATTNFIGTIEYRFLVDRLSHAFMFLDQGCTQDLTKSTQFDLPLGFGVGFAYGTKLGTFALVGALGKFVQTTFDFRDFKIHFGYTAYF